MNLQLQMPPVNDKYKTITGSERLLEMQGRPFVDLGCAVAVEQCAFPAALSRIAYAHYATLTKWPHGLPGMTVNCNASSPVSPPQPPRRFSAAHSLRP